MFVPSLPWCIDHFECKKAQQKDVVLAPERSQPGEQPFVRQMSLVEIVQAERLVVARVRLQPAQHATLLSQRFPCLSRACLGKEMIGLV